METGNIGQLSCKAVVAQFKTVDQEHQLLAALELLRSAAIEGRVDVLKWVLDRGIIANDESFVLKISAAAAVAIKGNYPPIVEFIIERYPEHQGEILLSGILAAREASRCTEPWRFRRSIVWLKNRLTPAQSSEVRALAQEHNAVDAADWIQECSLPEKQSGNDNCSAMEDWDFMRVCSPRAITTHFSQKGVEDTALRDVFLAVAQAGLINVFRHVVEKCGKVVDYQSYGLELYFCTETFLLQNYLLLNGLLEIDLTVNDHELLRWSENHPSILSLVYGRRDLWCMKSRISQPIDELVNECLESGSDVMLEFRRNLMRVLRKSIKTEYFNEKGPFIYSYLGFFDKYLENIISRRLLELGFDGTIDELEKLIDKSTIRVAVENGFLKTIGDLEQFIMPVKAERSIRL